MAERLTVLQRHVTTLSVDAGNQDSGIFTQELKHNSLVYGISRRQTTFPRLADLLIDMIGELAAWKIKKEGRNSTIAK